MKNQIMTMKNVWMLLGVIAVFAVAFSCEDIDPTPQFRKSNTDVTVTASPQSVATSAADSLNEVITFTWNDPNYTVGLEQTKFSLRVGAEDGDFTRFISKDFSGQLSGTLLGKELNGMALAFGGEIGEPITLDAMVVSSLENNNEPKNSNVLKITVTPYGDLNLTPSSTEVVTSAATSTEEAVSLSWNTAFNGFEGVKTYQLQYAAGGTDFASPTTIDVTSFSHSFNQSELNKIALANGVTAGEEGPVDFRIKATNELGTVMYSNTATVNVTTYIAYKSIGIIGDATAGDWGTDTDMYRPDPVGAPTSWTVTTYLIGGKSVKFRADDSWDNNWGSASFPSGTGVQNGANIPVSNSGVYKVDFNVGTGAYTFTPVTTTNYTNIGLIGEQSGWGSEIADLTQDANNSQVWTGVVSLTAGQLKFRANHDWGTNWGISNGAATSLSGFGALNGGNMEITEAGSYFVYINVASGEYFFGKGDRNVPYSDIGLIGTATPGGWTSDTNLIKDPTNPYKWSGTLTLTEGEAKFRADNDWAVNWGADSFPTGVATQNGANIPVAEGGNYFITFNSATGEYSFAK
jgi:starch-binding outer membrane protein SusE/F